MEKNWIDLGFEIVDGLEYRVLQCKKCGELTYQGNWTDYGVIADVPGCDHWVGIITDDIVEIPENVKDK